MHTDHTQLTLHEEVAKVSDKGAIETTGYVWKPTIAIVNHFEVSKTWLVLMKLTNNILQIWLQEQTNIADMPIVVYLGLLHSRKRIEWIRTAIALTYYLAACSAELKTLEYRNLLTLVLSWWNPAFLYLGK
jgi:hypothetical protein